MGKHRHDLKVGKSLKTQKTITIKYWEIRFLPNLKPVLIKRYHDKNKPDQKENMCKTTV